MSDLATRQLLFEVGPHTFAVEARKVREVIDPPEATPVPGAPSAVQGIINVRGTLMTAAELAKLLDVSASGNGEVSVVVLESGRRRLALEVGRVVAVAEPPERGLDVGSDLLAALGAGDAVRGVGEFGKRPYFQLSVQAIFNRVLGEDDERDE